ncbi:hypothetical protein ACLQ2S_25100 [Micromonospora sp. DT48]
MRNRPDTGEAEPATVPIRTYAVRRTDNDLNAFTDTIVALLDHERTMIDLSRYDNGTGIVELRVVAPEPRNEP